MKARLLYTALRPPYPLRIAHGGQRSLHELFTALQSTGEVVCEVLTNVAPEYVSKFLPHNVVIQRRVADMKLVYSQTRLLLVPSQWEEALGRVVFEANCSGIPAIVSQIGGLPEILGFGGLSIGDYSNVDAWVAALLSAQCPEKMDSLRVGARLNGARDDFSPQKVAGRFLEILSDGCRK